MREKVLYGVVSLLVIASLFLSYQVYSLRNQVKTLGLQVGENKTAITNVVNFLNQAIQANQK